MHPKSFVIIFITYVYTIDIPHYGISQRQLVFRVYIIHSNNYLGLESRKNIVYTKKVYEIDRAETSL